MPTYLFWLFALVMLIGGIAVVSFRNPVSSALSVVASFVGMAGLFVGLNAYFVAIIQILVYTGAVMVLFLFIIMLLDLKAESPDFRPRKPAALLAGLAVLAAFSMQITSVIRAHPNQAAPPLDAATLHAAAVIGVETGKIPADGKIATALDQGKLPDTHLLGMELFTRYNLPLQMLGVLLLVATVGVVVLSKRGPSSDPSD